MTAHAPLALRVSRRARKVAHALGSARGRRGLALGSASALEHRGALREVAEAAGGAERVATVVDVGANRGQFALAAHEAFPNAALHAVEPLPEAADRFARLFADAPRVTLHRCALGAEAAELTMHVAARSDSSSLLAPARQEEVYPGAGAVVARRRVPVRPLAALGIDLRPPALLKLDVQGYELAALEGCGALLERFGHVYAELSFLELYAGQPLAHEAVAWLAARGFRLRAVHMGDGAWDREGRAVQGDFLFERAPR